MKLTTNYNFYGARTNKHEGFLLDVKTAVYLIQLAHLADGWLLTCDTAEEIHNACIAGDTYVTANAITTYKDPDLYDTVKHVWPIGDLELNLILNNIKEVSLEAL